MKNSNLFLYIALLVCFIGATSCGNDDAANSQAKDYELAALANAKLNPQVVKTETTVTQIVRSTSTQVVTQPAPVIIYTVTTTASSTSTNTAGRL